ncbi:MAG: hypothetical protein KDB18_13435 [Salinibacterium sp.]|nr:hypothetical protein [Salinibacterium sp.]
MGKLNYAWTNTESLLIYLMAHLMGTSKETAIVTFLTLNTTRARLDFIERLAKMKSTSPESRKAVLDIAGRLKAEGKLRNKYNHCIYSFNERGELESTQLMRIAEFGNDLKYGKVEQLDADEIGRIDKGIRAIGEVNRTIWEFIRTNEIET